MRLGAPEHRTRQGDGGTTSRRARLDGRAAWIAEAEQLGGLVESLAERVVECRAEPLILAHISYDESLGVAAGNEQQQIGKGKIVGEACSQGMRLEVIDRYEGQSLAKRDRFAGNDANDEPAD